MGSSTRSREAQGVGPGCPGSHGHSERCLSDNMYYGQCHVNDINGLACSITLYPICDMDLSRLGRGKGAVTRAGPHFLWKSRVWTLAHVNNFTVFVFNQHRLAW